MDLTPNQKKALLARLLRERANQSPTTFPLSYGRRSLWADQQVAPSVA
jgi:hypothetical protein